MTDKKQTDTRKKLKGFQLLLLFLVQTAGVGILKVCIHLKIYFTQSPLSLMTECSLMRFVAIYMKKCNTNVSHLTFAIFIFLKNVINCDSNSCVYLFLVVSQKRLPASSGSETSYQL